MAIIIVGDLPTAIQEHELAATMVAGANAKASRVAPCLISPTATWAATTAYAVGQTVKLAAGGSLEVTTAGTSGATAPAIPTLGETVTDGTVIWTAIAPTVDQLVEAKLVLIGAVKRWAEAGAGAFQQQTAGPFGVTVDTRQRTGFNLWPSEIADLQDICKGDDDTSNAFAVDTVADDGQHSDACSLNFGATYCSCGADIAGFPIFGDL